MNNDEKKMDSPTDEWETPQWLFDELNKEFGFIIDLAANENNSKVELYCEDFIDGTLDNAGNRFLNAIYKGQIYSGSAWLNPPYSQPFPFIKKAWEISKGIRTVCLVKVDPSTKWWAIFWDYELHKPKSDVEVRFLPKRLKFVYPSRINMVKKINSANFPSAIIIMDRRHINA